MKIFSKISIIVLLLAIVVTPITSQAKPYYNAPYRHEVGLNVHWALSGFGQDSIYNERMFESKTGWAREHFSIEVFSVDNPQAWYERYDKIMQHYQDHDVKVVGMLAYGMEKGERKVDEEDLQMWLTTVENIVTRYKDSVEVWEVWNEPDSPTFLEHNSPEEYVKILKPTYDVIKANDSTAKVMSAGLASPNQDFMKTIFEQAPGKFDIVGVHYYYGEKYYEDGQSLARLEKDAKEFKELVASYDPTLPIWVTEMGLSTGSAGITEARQKEYLDVSTELLLQKGYANRVFIYNFRNYDYNTVYENNFGLVDNEIMPRESWQWYLDIPRGPYDIVRLPVDQEQLKAQELKERLEFYFGKGLIPISEENWPTVVQAYVYGGYSVQAIVQSIRFGGKTVHPQFSNKFWSQTKDYQDFIDKDWTGGPILYAYGKQRIKLDDEMQKAQELLTALNTHHDFSKLQITQAEWGDLIKAYVYGGYPVSAIARAVISDWKTVSKTMHFNEWQNTPDFKEGMQIQL